MREYVSGAVLPGVTVEVSSPAVVAHIRTEVTDGSGKYRYVDLQPGTYTSTFTLPGFVAQKREGIDVRGELTLDTTLSSVPRKRGSWVERFSGAQVK
jgi:Carboxypeptidase regulatory-like domain